MDGVAGTVSCATLLYEPRSWVTTGTVLKGTCTLRCSNIVNKSSTTVQFTRMEKNKTKRISFSYLIFNFAFIRALFPVPPPNFGEVHI